MITSIAIQEIHDTMRAGQARYAMPEQDRTDWQAMWRQRGVRLMKLADELEEVTRQRDMLARRCAEQAEKIAELVNPYKQRHLGGSIHDAIKAMQRNGQAL